MLRRILPLGLVAATLVGGATFRGDALHAGDDDLVSVAIESPRKRYLLGEPVLLDVTLRNTSPKPIAAYLVPHQYIEVYAGPAGARRRLIDRYGEAYKISLQSATLKPDEAWDHHLRILYVVGSDRDRRPAYWLALPKPGKYEILARLPLMSTDPDIVRDGARYYSSKAIEVQVVEPKGDDEKIYGLIYNYESRYFLNNGRSLAGSGSDRATALEMARLLIKYPRSGYREAMRRALDEFNRFARSGLRPTEAALIDQALSAQ